MQIIISGDLFFVQNLGEEMVVVNSQHIAEALLDKRSRIYSDRPYLATLEPCAPSEFLYSISLRSCRYGLSIDFAFIGYGDEWRLCRRLVHQTFRPKSAVKFRPMQTRRAREMVANLIDDPQHYHDHFATSANDFYKLNVHLPVHRFSLSIVMSAVYGYDISARDDPVVKIVVKALIPGVAVLTPERALMLKTFPFCELNSLK
jgi:hypothetical protein